MWLGLPLANLRSIGQALFTQAKPAAVRGDGTHTINAFLKLCPRTYTNMIRLITLFLTSLLLLAGVQANGAQEQKRLTISLPEAVLVAVFAQPAKGLSQQFAG